MDLLQKTANLVERQRKKKQKQIKDDENSNKIDEALKRFLKSHAVASADFAKQQMYLKANQKQLTNLSQWPSFLPRELVHVKILHAISPKELFVLKKCDETLAEKFHRELTEDYNSNKHQLVYCLKVGTICVAKTTKGWQRCRILKLHEQNACDVSLIDIGMKERVKWNDLRMLDGKWFQTKPLAIRCTLVSIMSAHSIDRVTMLQQQEFSRILQAKTDFYVFCNRSDVVSSDIFLYYKLENQFRCVNEIFPSDTLTDDSSIDETEMSMRIGNRTPSTGEHFSPKDPSIERSGNEFQMTKMELENSGVENETPTNHIDQNGNHKINKHVEEHEQEHELRNPTPPLDKLVSKPEPVIVKHIDGIDGIYICFKQYLPGVKRLRFQIQNCVHLQPDISPRSWKIGDYCLVFDSFDGISEWLRGLIVKIIDSKTYEIYLRDDGKTIESSVYNLKAISEDLKKVRDFTWKMKLSYIQMEKNCPSEKINDLLGDIVAGCDDIAISALRENNGIILWGIKRLSGALLPERYDYININEELVKQKVATTRVDFNDINNAVNNLVNKKSIELDDSDDDRVVTNRKKDVKRWLTSQPILKREFVAFPQYFTQQKMYLSVLEANRKTIAEEIYKVLNKKGQAAELEKRDSLEWKKEDACFAPFGGDRNYYRATVRRVNFAKNSCVVRFIDYGNCETCSLDALRKANMFGDIPVLARLYALDNIKAPNDHEEWPEYVRDFCINTVVDKQCNLIVVEAESDTKSPDDPEFCILEIFTKDKDLGNTLVTRGYAERIRGNEQ